MTNKSKKTIGRVDKADFPELGLNEIAIKIIDSYKNDHTDSNDNATKTQKRHLLYICNLMKKYTISLVIILFCCYACSNDDDSNLNENNLAGEWNLAEILCYCDEIPTINEGEQV